jgi:flavin-binding protein dodecin
MAKQINLTYCGMDGSGPTVREAKLDATRKIEKAIASRYSCAVIATVEGSIFVVHGGLEAGSYSIAGKDRKYGMCSSHSRDSFEEACQQAANHAADAFGGIAWANGIDEEVIEKAKARAIEMNEQRARILAEQSKNVA